MVVFGNTEHQLYTFSLLLLLRQGAGIPKIALIPVICRLQDILIVPSIRHAVNLWGIMPINSNIEHH